jgi:hypothetical protein
MVPQLSDPAWLAVGVAALAILVTVAVYFAERQRKQISYEILENIPLLTIAEENLGELELMFRRVVVKNSRFFIAQLSNSGNVPIQPSDYEAAISINFGQGPQVLSAAITRRVPTNLSVSVTFPHTEIAPQLPGASRTGAVRCRQTGAVRQARLRWRARRKVDKGRAILWQKNHV